MVHFQYAPAKERKGHVKAVSAAGVRQVQRNIADRTLQSLYCSYVLQMPQWCVLAGLGIIHFLQTDTNGMSFFI